MSGYVGMTTIERIKARVNEYADEAVSIELIDIHGQELMLALHASNPEIMEKLKAVVELLRDEEQKQGDSSNDSGAV